jgi:hypothetical protein
MPTSSCAVCGGPYTPEGEYAYDHKKDCRIWLRLARAAAMAEYKEHAQGTSLDLAPTVQAALEKYAKGDWMTADELTWATEELERAAGRRRKEDPAILQRDQALLDYLRRGQGG